MPSGANDNSCMLLRTPTVMCLSPSWAMHECMPVFVAAETLVCRDAVSQPKTALLMLDLLCMRYQVRYATIYHTCPLQASAIHGYTCDLTRASTARTPMLSYKLEWLCHRQSC